LTRVRLRARRISMQVSRPARGLSAVLLAAVLAASRSPAARGADMKDSFPALEKELTAKYGEAVRPGLERGLKQVAGLWRPEDGDSAAFEEFVRTNFAGAPETRDALFSRMEFALESLDGHMLEISRDFRRQSDLDLGTIYPFDDTLAGYDPSAHVLDDFFGHRLAFTVLL